MRSLGSVATALALIVGSLVAAPALAGLVPPAPALPLEVCDAATGPLYDTQDDAGSGRDAADCRAQALRLTKDGYFWGFIGASDAAPGADPADWFAADMSAVFGEGAYVTYGVALAATYYTNGLSLPHQPFALEVWLPGEASPWTLHSCGSTLGTTARTGLTYLRLRTASPLEALPCPSGPYLPGDAGAAPAGATYGFYFGCHPHCVIPNA